MPDAVLKLADDLMELRRYVLSDPDHVKASIDNVGLMTNPVILNCGLRRRLNENLQIARDFIRVEPEIARGYLYAAAFEIRRDREKRG